MALISRAIANLFNGVSQQPATLRAPNQAEEQENVYSAVATGAGKRPSATYVAKLSATPSGTAAVHWINRDTTERYEVRIRSGSIEVYNILTGAAQTVSTPSGLAYLTSTNPAADFALVTVADFTFIVNRTVTTAKEQSNELVEKYRKDANQDVENLKKLTYDRFGRNNNVELENLKHALANQRDGYESSQRDHEQSFINSEKAHHKRVDELYAQHRDQLETSAKTYRDASVESASATREADLDNDRQYKSDSDQRYRALDERRISDMNQERDLSLIHI